MIADAFGFWRGMIVFVHVWETAGRGGGGLHGSGLRDGIFILVFLGEIANT